VRKQRSTGTNKEFAMKIIELENMANRPAKAVGKKVNEYL
jgi:hypothetical protein